MRKRYAEKLSFYKLLDELNQLPDECTLAPIYIERVFDEKLKYIDFYVMFTRHFRDTEDVFSNIIDDKFTLLFMFKSNLVRLSSNVRFCFETTISDVHLKDNFVLNSQILTLSDFIRAFLYDNVNFTHSLKNMQELDNETFSALMQT